MYLGVTENFFVPFMQIPQVTMEASGGRVQPPQILQ